MTGSKLGIRHRVLLITLLPLLLITFILGGYFISTRIDDAQATLYEKGETISRMLSSSAEFGMLINNSDILSNLIQASIKADNEVVDIIFLDIDFKTIVRGLANEEKLDPNAGYPLVRDNRIYFLKAVTTTGVDFADDPDLIDQPSEPDFIGWVVVALTQKPTQLRQNEIFTKGILIAAVVFLITLLIAMRFSKRITNPILGLTHVVEMLQEGHLATRANTSSTGELKSLAQGINRLAQRVYESNQTLESRVEKATKRLRSTLIHLEKQNQALDRAKNQADLASLAKDEFLARMSHELRTPLTSVSGFSRLLDQTHLNDEQKEYTRIINLTSDLLLSIIDDILDYSKLESNAVELEKITFDFEKTVVDVVEMQTATAQNKGLELIPIISSPLPKGFIGDPVRVKQILTNLISNAVKFTDQGYVSISIESRKITSLEYELEITVEDTGAGIPKDRLDKLFQAFSQADTSIKRRYGGSGLGLVIAKRLTELMGGDIKLNSELNQGTKAVVTIPLTATKNVKADNQQTVKQLIIHDPNPIALQALKKQLSQHSNHIHLCESPDRVFQQVAEDENCPIVWGISPGEVSAETINNVKSLLQSSKSTIVIVSPKPLPIPQHPRLIQLRKPARGQLIYNALSPEKAADKTIPENRPLTLGSDLKVLIAEDNDFNRLLLKRILEGAGCQIIECSNGQEAVQQFVRTSPDIILMDVHMPVMDGIEATREIRLSNQEIPIIALTANVIASEHTKLVAAGITQILLKPINDTELCQTLVHFSEHTEITSVPATEQRETTDLQKYAISEPELANELRKQLSGIEQGFEDKNIQKMRNHSHQLMGLTGLYEIPEIEVSAHHLHNALLKEDMKLIWKGVWQLRRVINSETIEELEEP